MMKHLLKLIWNRKRTSILIILEIFFSFLVLWAAITFAVYSTNNYLQPLGFSYENVWNITVSTNSERGVWTPEMTESTRQLLLALESFDEIESAAKSLDTPYDFSTSASSITYRGRQIFTETTGVSDSFKEVMDLDLAQGRWFEKSDDALNWDPVVINQKLSQYVFGAEDPLGKNIASEGYPRERRIIGVISDFRKHGEFSDSVNYLFSRERMDDPSHRTTHNLLVKVRPGTTAALEEKIITKFQAIARDWSFEVKPLSQMRASYLRLRLAPLIAAGVIAAFLMIMVGLGLVGVLWQNVTQRTKEIGLRRALGGTTGSIYRQILGELLVISSIGLILGTAVMIQLPLLDVIGFLSTKVYFYGMVISLLIIYLLTILCGLYPSWLATKVQPAEALHYE